MQRSNCKLDGTGQQKKAHLSGKCHTSKRQRIRKYCKCSCFSCAIGGGFLGRFHANIVLIQSHQCWNIVLMITFLNWASVEMQLNYGRSKIVYYLFVSRPTLHSVSDELNFLSIFLLCLLISTLLAIRIFAHTCHFPFPIELTSPRHKRLNIALFIFVTWSMFPIDVNTKSTLNHHKTQRIFVHISVSFWIASIVLVYILATKVAVYWIGFYTHAQRKSAHIWWHSQNIKWHSVHILKFNIVWALLACVASIPCFHLFILCEKVSECSNIIIGTAPVYIS